MNNLEKIIFFYCLICDMKKTEFYKEASHKIGVSVRTVQRKIHSFNSSNKSVNSRLVEDIFFDKLLDLMKSKLRNYKITEVTNYRGKNIEEIVVFEGSKIKTVAEVQNMF